MLSVHNPTRSQWLGAYSSTVLQAGGYYQSPEARLPAATAGTHSNQEINDMLLGYVILSSCQGMDKVNEGHRTFCCI